MTHDRFKQVKQIQIHLVLLRVLILDLNKKPIPDVFERSDVQVQPADTRIDLRQVFKNVVSLLVLEDFEDLERILKEMLLVGHLCVL